MSEVDQNLDRTIENLESDEKLQATLTEAAPAEMRAVHMQVNHAVQEKAASDDPGVKRTDDGILVYGKERVMEVFLNAEGNYSVTGYANRSERAFGDFFLGMDAGPEYDAQAGAINKAIMSMTLQDGFEAGVKATAATLGKLDDTSLDASELTDGMLAEVCKPLFGIPDGHLIVSGSLEFHVFGPCRCPGDYTPLSAYIFLPEPAFLIKILGPYLGRMLKRETLEFVKDLRSTGKPPEAPLTRVLYETIPPGQDDLFARTLVGIMMGLLPTTEGNMEQVLNHMRDDGSYSELAAKVQALSDPMDADGAASILRDPMYRAMQKAPMPPAVWRTAAKDHMLGPLAVRTGDKISISIKDATNEDLDNGVANVDAIFGGCRTSEHPCPLHSCPGFELAIGIMLGTLATTMRSGRQIKQR